MNKVIVKPPCSKRMMDLTLDIAKNQTSKIRHCKRYYHMINTNHLEKHYAPEFCFFNFYGKNGGVGKNGEGGARRKIKFHAPLRHEKRIASTVDKYVAGRTALV
mgnify:CR=1 FL=1